MKKVFIAILIMALVASNSPAVQFDYQAFGLPGQSRKKKKRGKR